MKTVPTLIRYAVVILPGIFFMVFYNLRMEAQRLEPYIYKMSAGKVLVARIQGDPDITMDTAGVTLYSAGRKLKLSPCYMSGRHSAWNQSDTTPRQEWIVDYSRLVPETATTLADIQDSTEVSIFYERREMAYVAEILHIGRYEEIPRSLRRLRQFIASKGYRPIGFYEEVYLLFEQIEQDPDKYETLLRYQIARQ